MFNKNDKFHGDSAEYKKLWVMKFEKYYVPICPVSQAHLHM